MCIKQIACQPLCQNWGPCVWLEAESSQTVVSVVWTPTLVSRLKPKWTSEKSLSYHSASLPDDGTIPQLAYVPSTSSYLPRRGTSANSQKNANLLTSTTPLKITSLSQVVWTTTQRSVDKNPESNPWDQIPLQTHFATGEMSTFFTSWISCRRHKIAEPNSACSVSHLHTAWELAWNSDAWKYKAWKRIGSRLVGG